MDSSLCPQGLGKKNREELRLGGGGPSCTGGRGVCGGEKKGDSRRTSGSSGRSTTVEKTSKRPKREGDSLPEPKKQIRSKTKSAVRGKEGFKRGKRVGPKTRARERPHQSGQNIRKQKKGTTGKLRFLTKSSVPTLRGKRGSEREKGAAEATERKESQPATTPEVRTNDVQGKFYPMVKQEARGESRTGGHQERTLFHKRKKMKRTRARVPSDGGGSR